MVITRGPAGPSLVGEYNCRCVKKVVHMYIHVLLETCETAGVTPEEAPLHDAQGGAQAGEGRVPYQGSKNDRRRRRESGSVDM